MIPVREDFILVRQVCAPGINQINTGQAIFAGNFLGAEMLLDSQGEISPAFDGWIIGDNHTFNAMNPTNACDNACARGFILIHAMSGKGIGFQKGGTGV